MDDGPGAKGADRVSRRFSDARAMISAIGRALGRRSVIVPPDQETLPGPRAKRERMTPIKGLPGCNVTSPSGDLKVEATTLIGDPADGHSNPGWVVEELTVRVNRSAVDNVNLACAVAWEAYGDYANGDEDSATEKWRAAAATFRDAIPLLKPPEQPAAKIQLDALMGLIGS